MSYAMLSRKSAAAPAVKTASKAESNNLRTGEANDSFEQEADRVADEIMAGGGAKVGWSLSKMSVGAPLQRKCSCGGSGGSTAECEECKEKKTLQRKPADLAEIRTTPPIVHEVLRSPGHPLDVQTRSVFESSFGHDFSKVRVHADARAHESARAVNAMAYSVGSDLVFGAGQFAPGTRYGQRLLAHELAHVVQQSTEQPAASEVAIEHEASKAAHEAIGGNRVRMNLAARPGSILFERRTVSQKEFEVGDVVLNTLASTDFRTKGVLFGGPDQAHILVAGDKKLGYEVGYTKPDDPFRWQHLKDIVDNGHLDIFAVGATESFKVKEATGGVERIVDKALAEIGLGTGGITLPRLSVQKAINPNAKSYIASADDSRDRIYYDSSGGGRGMAGSNSLAHELFGHLWLSMKGVSWQHGGQITATQGIQDPFGRPYAGDVNDYISRYAGDSGTALESPTQGVSSSLLSDTLSWFSGMGAAGLTRGPKNTFTVSPAFGAQWERLSGNYSILKFHHESDVQPPSTMANVVTTADGLRKWIVSWVGTLNADQKWVFKSFLSALTKSWSAPQNRRTEFALEVGPML